jgi:2-polyprenyl-3-methyl-5-hydroxy-6-metoxy-1,4-benzoquinol methylase
MPLGPGVRRLLGRWEPAAIRVYRSAFIDLDELAAVLATSVPTAKRILEIGCGDGAMAAAVRRALPSCEILGIDPVVSAPGRLYGGDRTGVQFRRISTGQLINERLDPFDLVILCDVLHHVSEQEREQVLADAACLTVAGGTVAIKEWEKRAGIGNTLAYLADRWVSGDSTVRFMPETELRAKIAKIMPGWPVTLRSRIPPRKANLLLTLRRP